MKEYFEENWILLIILSISIIGFFISYKYDASVTIHQLLFGNSSLFAIFSLFIKHSQQKNLSKFINRLEWDTKVREKAAGVAEYLAFFYNLESTDSKDIYRKINKQSFELAMWLPEDIYKKMGPALVSPSGKQNIGTIILEIRKILLNEQNCRLTEENIIYHAPNIGKIKNEETKTHTR